MVAFLRRSLGERSALKSPELRQIRAREAGYPIPLTTAIAFPEWANIIGYVLYAPGAAATDAPVENVHRHAPAAVRTPSVVRAPGPAVASGAAAGTERVGRCHYKSDRDGGDQFDDGFDRVALPDGAEDTLGAIYIPSCVERRDGLPVPFSPEDTRHDATFVTGTRDEHEVLAL